MGRNKVDKGKVLIIGGCGYLGSRLFQHLTKKEYPVDTLDLEWFGNVVNPKNIKENYRFISQKRISRYKTIILLAGNSSIPMSEGRMLQTFRNNVINFLYLLDRISDQKFIYASSSSVYGNTRQNEVTEDYDRYIPSNYYDLSKKEIDYYAHLSSINYFGLRMGTVCGYSPNLRVDVMINKMYDSAVKNKEIQIFNKDFYRPILGIEDFCRAVEVIIKKDKPAGLYNLASFNMTIEEIAKKVARKVGKTKITIIGKNPDYYNFSVNTKKFEETFDFQFRETVDTILDSLVKGYEKAEKGIRV
jgi:UDP-glucose 4-epimerase